MYARNYIHTNKQNPDNLRKLTPTNLVNNTFMKRQIHVHVYHMYKIK